ncbi:MAG: polyphosphate--glucose phosphotransferase, partial [Candidatus Binatia bacterium]
MKVLGIDIGGSGIKGAPVDLRKGSLAAARFRIPTPEPAEPEAVAEVVTRIVRHFRWKGPVGCTLPAVIKSGVAWTAANIDEAWVGTNVQALLRRATGCPVVALNDADAAGIAEMELGAGKGRRGVVFMLTLGTGIGSAIFNDGVLLPNTELGHLRVRGKDAEERASDRAREERDWSWNRWARHVNEYLLRLEELFFPDLFIIGGGVSKKHEKFIPLLETRAPVVPARLRNEAGIVGA